MDDDLARCRSEIDAIDEKIITLLAKRFAVVDRIIAHKQAAGLPAEIPQRVQSVLSRVRDLGVKHGLPPTLPDSVWRLIIAETITYERRRNVT